MSRTFFSHPILNSPYTYRARHWELDKTGQPTNRVIEARRGARYVSPIPRSKKQRPTSKSTQRSLELGDSTGLSTPTQRYDPTPVINELTEVASHLGLAGRRFLDPLGAANAEATPGLWPSLLERAA